MNTVTVCIIIFFYIAVSLLDIRLKSVPIWLWTIPVITVLIAAGLDGTLVQGISIRLIWGGILFLFGLILCVLQGMGGADALMMGTVGFAFGDVGIPMMLFGFIFALPVAAIAAKNTAMGEKTAYPLIPPLTGGVITVLVIMVLQGISTTLIFI